MAQLVETRRIGEAPILQWVDDDGTVLATWRLGWVRVADNPQS